MMHNTQGMFVDIQIDDRLILAEMLDEKDDSVMVKCLEETADEGRYSFRGPVWINREYIINSYSAVTDIDSLGYEEISDNLFISNDLSDVEFVPDEDEEEDDDDDDVSLCSDDSLN